MLKDETTIISEGCVQEICNEKAAIDKALNAFTNDMRARMYEMAGKGRRGWNDQKWANDIAADMAADAVNAVDFGTRTSLHDIANRAMMLWWQEYGTIKGEE